MSTLVHVGVRASNLPESLRFWRDGLGLRVVRERDDRHDLTDGHHNFAILQHTGEARPRHVGGMLDYLHIGVGVPDAAAVARRHTALGYQIFSDGLGGRTPLDPSDLRERAFKVEDPDGITVDVSEVAAPWPGATLHPNGPSAPAAGS